MTKSLNLTSAGVKSGSFPSSLLTSEAVLSKFCVLDLWYRSPKTILNKNWGLIIKTNGGAIKKTQFYRAREFNF
jgi:hypothetical protein